MRRALQGAVPALLAVLSMPLIAAADAAAAPRLIATAGPGHTITLKTPGGAPVRSVRAGVRYSITVHDRSSVHNFRLTGPGFSRQTGIAATGTRTWNITFRRGAWTYLCQPHPHSMRGTFRAA